MPEFPKPLLYLWHAYMRMRRRMAPSPLGGPLPLTWTEIGSFERLTGAHLAPWEVELVEALDDLYLVEYARGRGQGDE